MSMITLKRGTKIYLYNTPPSYSFITVIDSEHDIVFHEAEVDLCFNGLNQYYEYKFSTPKKYNNALVESYAWWRE